MDELLLRELTPAVIGLLVRRGVDFATAEDAVQVALIQASLTWPDRHPDDPKGWLVTVAWRKFLDSHRSDTARRDREQRVEDAGPPPGAVKTTTADDTLALFFLCAHPLLTPASAVAFTLRALGGLTTRQIAEAYHVDLAAEAIRLARQLASISDRRFAVRILGVEQPPQAVLGVGVRPVDLDPELRELRRADRDEQRLGRHESRAEIREPAGDQIPAGQPAAPSRSPPSSPSRRA